MSIVCIVMSETLSISFFLFFFDNIFISMYIMCVCLFSALSRRIGALQTSIIIIINESKFKKALQQIGNIDLISIIR